MDHKIIISVVGPKSKIKPLSSQGKNEFDFCKINDEANINQNLDGQALGTDTT